MVYYAAGVLLSWDGNRMKKILLSAIAGLVSISFMSTVRADSGWVLVEGRIMTRWASGVTPENAHQEYPRPGMERDRWRNLNGL